MGNPNTFLTQQADGQYQQEVFLRIPKQKLVSPVAHGNTIALQLRQADSDHQYQWRPKVEPADSLLAVDESNPSRPTHSATSTPARRTATPAVKRSNSFIVNHILPPEVATDTLKETKVK